MNRLLIFPLLAIFVLSACLFDNSKGDPIYKTDYSISLNSLPDSLPLDSMLIEILIQDVLDSVIRVDSIDLARSGDVVEFQLSTAPGQSITIEYVVFAGAHQVASGTDIYDPSSPNASTPDSLQIDTLQLDSALAEVPRINEDLRIAFANARDTILEGQTPEILLVLQGDSNARLVGDRRIQIQCTGGSVASTQFSLTGQVTLPRNAKNGDAFAVSFASLPDNRVYGDLNAILKISDAGGLRLGTNSIDTITIHDLDSAWVEFPSPTLTLLKTAGLSNLPVKLRISPSTSKLGKSVEAKVLVHSGTALPTYDYSFSTSTKTFPIDAENGAELGFPITILDDQKRDSADNGFTASIQILAGPSFAPSSPLTVTIHNNHNEYVVVVNDSSATLLFYSPEGVLLKSVTNSNLQGVQGISIDTHGILYFAKANEFITYNPFTNTFASQGISGDWQSIWIQDSVLTLVSRNKEVQVLEIDGTPLTSFALPNASEVPIRIAYDSSSEQIFYASFDTASQSRSGIIHHGSWGVSPTEWISPATSSDTLGLPTGIVVVDWSLWVLTTSDSDVSAMHELNALTGTVTSTHDISELVNAPIGVTAAPNGHLYILSEGDSTGFSLVEWNPYPWQFGESSNPHTWGLTGNFSRGAIAYLRTDSELAP